jgi:replicative DNA helicase
MDLTRNKKGRKDAAIDISNLIYGKVPPQAVELEESVLGAIMLEKDAIDIAADLLTVDSFYRDANKRIYGAMLRLNNKNQPIDIQTVVEELKEANELEIVGGAYYVTQLTNSVVSSAHIERHCQIVKQKQLARGMINIGGNTVVKAYEEGDIFDLIEEHDRQMSDLLAGVMGKGFSGMDECLLQAYQDIERRRTSGDIMTGVPSGFTELDRITNGFQNSTLIILAARPAVGKTALALQIARYAAMNNINQVPVAFFSLEMPQVQLTHRSISAESEIPLSKIIRGDLTDEEMRIIFGRAMQKMLKARIFFDDTGGLSITQLRAKARKLKRKWLKEFKTEKGMIIIDYLQLMSGSGNSKGNREQEISEISRGLKALSKELDIPIIALSQLSRAVESRTGEKKMPQLSDLRESGAIEQDADTVIFIYRPEYYDITTNQEGESTKGETHLKIAKHRAGILETVKLRADLSIQKFSTWDDGWAAPTSFKVQNGSERYDSPKDNRIDDECPF